MSECGGLWKGGRRKGLVTRVCFYSVSFLRTSVCLDPKDVEDKEKDELEKVVERLTELANEIPFTPPEVESDAPEGDPSDR